MEQTPPSSSKRRNNSALPHCAGDCIREQLRCMLSAVSDLIVNIPENASPNMVLLSPTGFSATDKKRIKDPVKT